MNTDQRRHHDSGLNSFRKEALWSEYNSYHDHKENMAHAAILVNLALVGAIVSASEWPPSWVAVLPFCGGRFISRVLAFCAAFAMSFLIYFYMRWQLRNRRIAERWSDSLSKVLWKWANSHPCECEVNPLKEAIVPAKYLWVEYIWPLRSPGIPQREIDDFRNYPSALTKAYQNKSSGTYVAELLMTGGTLFLWILIFARTFVPVGGLATELLTIGWQHTITPLPKTSSSDRSSKES